MIKWFEQAGHFCDAKYCHWHLHTHTEKYCISSIGEYFPIGATQAQPLSSSPELYEHMIAPLTEEFPDLDSFQLVARANTREEATKTHLDLVVRYS